MSVMMFNLEPESGAVFSPCRQYRYDLWRVWDASLPKIAYIGLNPSTADETKNDPTVTRCIERAKRLGFGGMHMLNLFGFRATLPSDMRKASDPVGEDNNAELIRVLSKEASCGVACWGTHGKYQNRQDEVIKLMDSCGLSMYYLVLNSDGTPKHPLYVSYREQLKLWTTSETSPKGFHEPVASSGTRTQ